VTPECDALLAAADAKLRAADLLLTEGLPDDAAHDCYCPHWRDRLCRLAKLRRLRHRLRQIQIGDCLEMILAEPRFAAAQPSEREALFECLRLKQFDAARELARRLTQRYPGDALGWKVLGTLLVHQGDHEAARSALEEARRLDPRDAEILNSLGQVYQETQQDEAALALYREALILRPDLAELRYNLGRTQQRLGRLDEALESYDQAIERRPDYAKAHSNRGTLLRDLGRPEEALLAYDRLLALHPESAETLNNRALALQDLGRQDEALANLDRALAIEPDFVAALNNRGNVLKERGCLEEALESYEGALSLQPDLIVAAQNRLLCLNYLSTWPSDRIIAEHRAFGQRLEARIARLEPEEKRDRDPERRLRLGFVSGDFRQHSVVFFLLPVLERLDRRGFEVYCYSTGSLQDDWTQDCRRLADVWVEATCMEHRALAERIRADGIDLLLDLAGHTKGNALPVFAAKPAPVQVSWLGYPNTTGLTTIDYRLVDAVTDPPAPADANQTERLIRLPKGFLCYRPWTSPPPPPVAPAPCLERGWVTFGSFNNLAKITPATLELWTAVLRAVPDSRLRLKSNLAADLTTWERLVESFVAQGIARERLEIQPRAPYHHEHLAAYGDIDISLDTFPYHGTTTTCEAILMGVPVVTLVGDRHAARVGASLLTHIGLPELIADSREDYVRLATRLASDRAGLTRLRAELRERLERSPVRDEVGFTRILETTLRRMWRRWCAGEPPRAFEVEPAERPPLTGEQQAAMALFNAGRYTQAEIKARQLIERRPTDALGWKLLGTSLVKSDRYAEAIPTLLEAIRLDKDDAASLNSLGFALMRLGRLNEAIGAYKRALEVDPRYYWAHNNLGTVYRDQGRVDRAIECYDRALAIAPDYVEAHSNRSVAFEEFGLLEESVAGYRRALELDPNSVVVLNNLGKTQMLLGQLDAAQQSYRRALEIQPDLKQSFDNLLLCLNYQDRLSPRQVFDEHRAFERTQARRVKRLPSLKQSARDPDRVLRLGFVSGDLRFHSVSFFLLPILEQLDRRHFEVFCYSMSHRQDEATQKLRALADGWLDCPALPEPELAKRIRDDGIDLLFDLSGHTSPNALLAFAARPAPVQINWIGYPNTTGLSAMDYRLVDDLTDPPGVADDYHTERLIRLPTGFLCYRPWPTGFELSVAEPPCLDAGRITFGSFNNLSKITPTTLAVWVELMRAIPSARLLLKSHTASDIQIWNRLVERFDAEGIASERLEFLPRAPSYTEHLEQYRHLDIALDTLPYNGTTTTCEALFMGVPVVTLGGDRHAARVGLSLMTRVGLPEFVAHSTEDYVAIAMRWAADPGPLRGLRSGLRDRLELSPLRDEAGFTRTLETVLRRMWHLWCDGAPARVFEVPNPKNGLSQSKPDETAARDKKKVLSEPSPRPGSARHRPPRPNSRG
jgi:predicted O-linked N-acetylglucosamine transferase (SPINDLY family)